VCLFLRDVTIILVHIPSMSSEGPHQNSVVEEAKQLEFTRISLFPL
jgi:hypothetical protein